MKLARQQQSEKSESKVSRSDIMRRAQIADAIILKMSYGTFRFRQNLLNWLKEARKVTGFEAATLKSMGLLKDSAINGKIGAESKALRAANKAIFEQLMQVPTADLHESYRLMSSANIQRRYGRKVDDEEIGVAIELEGERAIDVGTKRDRANWLRSKQNAAVRSAMADAKQRIKAKQKRGHKTVRSSLKAYVASIRSHAEYVNEGIKIRRKWMNQIEARTKTKQAMSNLQ